MGWQEQVLWLFCGVGWVSLKGVRCGGFLTVHVCWVVRLRFALSACQTWRGVPATLFLFLLLNYWHCVSYAHPDPPVNSCTPNPL